VDSEMQSPGVQFLPLSEDRDSLLSTESEVIFTAASKKRE
jgi:hypothetical protein